MEFSKKDLNVNGVYLNQKRFYKTLKTGILLISYTKYKIWEFTILSFLNILNILRIVILVPERLIQFHIVLGAIRHPLLLNR